VAALVKCGRIYNCGPYDVLDALDQAESLTDLNVPGFNFHGLQGIPKRYGIHVNGPWCITFEWKDGDALKINLEQYH